MEKIPHLFKRVLFKMETQDFLVCFLLGFLLVIAVFKFSANRLLKSNIGKNTKKRSAGFMSPHRRPSKRKKWNLNRKIKFKKFNLDDNSKPWHLNYDWGEAFPTSNKLSDDESFYTPDGSPCDNEYMDGDMLDGSIYAEFVKYTEENLNYDINEFFRTTKPKSPPVKTTMQNFNSTYFKSCILYNLYRQKLLISEDTMAKIMLFFKKTFHSKNSKINLQVLVHLSKMDQLDLLDVMPDGGTMDDEFDFTIWQYVNYAMAGVTDPDAIITEGKKETTMLIKNALISPRMLTAFREVLLSVLGNGVHFSDEEIKNYIRDLKIYYVKYFSPLYNLRGACLYDGFLICYEHIAKVIGKNDLKYRADLITLSAHECGHYLGRKKSENFNMSTPFFTLPDGKKKVIFDPIYPANFFETGRNVELKLFDGLQPNWVDSDDRAATIFLNRLEDDTNSIPVVTEEERKKKVMRLIRRERPSCTFGIDLRLKKESYY